MRLFLYKLHKWVGLGLALFLLLQAVSGVFLVYRSPIEGLWENAPVNSGSIKGALDLDNVLSRLESEWPDYTVSRVTFPVDPGSLAIARIQHKEAQHHKFVGLVPVLDGAVHNLDMPHGLMFWVFQWHENMHLGTVGRIINIALGCALVFMGVTGVYFWWPLRKRQPLNVAWKAPSKIFWYDIHRVLGLVLVPLFFVLAVSGASISVRLLLIEAGAETGNTAVPAYTWVKLNPLVAEIEKMAAINEVRFNTVGQTATFLLATHQPSWPGGLDKAVVSLTNGRVIKVVKTTDVAVQQKLLGWLYPVHTSLALGSVGRFVLVWAGLGLVLIVISGCWLWWLRRPAKARRR